MEKAFIQLTPAGEQLVLAAAMLLASGVRVKFSFGRRRSPVNRRSI